MASTRNAGVRCRHVVTTGCASMKSQQRVYVPRAWHVIGTRWLVASRRVLPRTPDSDPGLTTAGNPAGILPEVPERMVRWARS